MLLGWLVKEEEGVKHVTSVEDKKNSYRASVKKAWRLETDCKT